MSDPAAERMSAPPVDCLTQRSQRTQGRKQTAKPSQPSMDANSNHLKSRGMWSAAPPPFRARIAPAAIAPLDFGWVGRPVWSQLARSHTEGGQAAGNGGLRVDFETGALCLLERRGELCVRHMSFRFGNQQLAAGFQCSPQLVQ